MAKRRQNINTQMLIARLVLLASLVAAAFAHTAAPTHFTTPAGFDERAYVAQYALPDGTLPILCDRTGEGETHHSSAMPCEFCSLADNIAIISPSTSVQEAYYANYLCIGISKNTELIKRTKLGLHGASRAPPLA